MYILLNLSNDYLGIYSMLLLFMLYVLYQMGHEKTLHVCIACSLTLEAPGKM